MNCELFSIMQMEMQTKTHNISIQAAFTVFISGIQSPVSPRFRALGGARIAVLFAEINSANNELIRRSDPAPRDKSRGAPVGIKYFLRK